MLYSRPTRAVLLSSAAFVAAAGAAHADESAEPKRNLLGARYERPQTVGERFDWVNRPEVMLVDGWEMRPSVTGVVGYDDNITLIRDDGPSSAEFTGRAAVEAGRDSGPFHIHTHATLGHTWYPDSEENNFWEGLARAAVTYDSKPLFLYGALSYQQNVERTIDNGIYVNGTFEPYTTRPEYQRVPLEFGAEYKISEVTLTGALHVQAVEYDDMTTTAGTFVNQDFRNGYIGDFRFRTSYDWTTDFAVFGEVSSLNTDYDDSQGDRDTWSLLGGVTVQFTRLLMGEASIGYSEMKLSQGGGVTDGFTYHGRLTYFVSDLVSLSLAGDRTFDGEITTTGVVTSARPITRDAVSLRAEWEPLRNFLVYGQAAYETEKHDTGTALDDNLTTLGVGAVYILTSSLRLTVDGSHEFGDADDTHELERSRVAVGLSVLY